MNILKLLKFTTKMRENEPEFQRKIIMSDKAHFQLGDYVNKQNYRIWGSENAKMIIEKPLYAQRVTVWCGCWAGGIIGPYCIFHSTSFENLFVGIC